MVQISLHVTSKSPGKNLSCLSHFLQVNGFLTCNRIQLHSISGYNGFIGLRKRRWDGFCSDCTPDKNRSCLSHYLLVNSFLTCNRIRLHSILAYDSFIGLRERRWDGFCSDCAPGKNRSCLSQFLLVNGFLTCNSHCFSSTHKGESRACRFVLLQ